MRLREAALQILHRVREEGSRPTEMHGVVLGTRKFRLDAAQDLEDLGFMAEG